MAHLSRNPKGTLAAFRFHSIGLACGLGIERSSITTRFRSQGRTRTTPPTPSASRRNARSSRESRGWPGITFAPAKLITANGAETNKKWSTYSLRLTRCLWRAAAYLDRSCTLIAGDLDFRPLITALVEMGINVELLYPKDETMKI
jgi:hypothetical protein